MGKLQELRKLNSKARASRSRKHRRDYDVTVYRYARLRDINGLAEAVIKATGGQEVTCQDCVRYLFNATSKDDRRLKSKHFRALCYAAGRDVPWKGLNKFIRRKGGINGCARLEAERRRRGMSKRKRSSG
jgi:hypothetical protein